jgi:hypothetical protein
MSGRGLPIAAFFFMLSSPPRPKSEPKEDSLMVGTTLANMEGLEDTFGARDVSSSELEEIGSRRCGGPNVFNLAKKVCLGMVAPDLALAAVAEEGVGEFDRIDIGEERSSTDIGGAR